MASAAAIPFLDITINPKNIDEEIVAVLRDVKPDWKREDIRSCVLAGGFVNTLKCFHLAQDKDMSDALVVRVLNTTIGAMVARDKEFMALQIAHNAGCFPRIYAAFKNGLVYEYAQGRMLTMDDITNPDIARKCTSVLCRFHNMDVKSLSLLDSKGNPGKYDTSRMTLRDMLINLPDKVDDPDVDASFQTFRKEMSNEMIQSEIDFMEGIMEQLSLPLSLNHGDFYMGNLIFNEATGRVTLLDFELTGFNYRSRDLALTFIWKPYMDIGGVTSPEEPDFTPEVRQMWLKSYLEAKFEAQSRNVSDITEQHVELFDLEHRILEIFSHLEMILLCLAMVNSDISDAFIEAAKMGRDCYFKLKRDIPELKKKYLELRSTK